MKRREFIGLVGGAAVMWPLTARAQQSERPGRLYHVAVLVQGAEQTMGSRLEALRAGLRDLGHFEGQNIRLTVRWNEGGLERLSELAAELLRDRPDIIVGAPVLAAVAAHKHTRTVPIVIANGSGPLQAGLAKSYARWQRDRRCQPWRGVDVKAASVAEDDCTQHFARGCFDNRNCYNIRRNVA
ncbi:MAG: ABC transporter substrate binding protein [Pseudolabrys sp.]